MMKDRETDFLVEVGRMFVVLRMSFVYVFTNQMKGD